MQKPLAMKARTLLDYEQKLSRARAYIVQHLDENLDTRRLAAEASMSLFHFHRVYLGFFGERPAETIRRLRLERASTQLRDTKLPLREIGRLAGYTSTPAFTRAFKRYSSLSPGAFREVHATATVDAQAGESVFTGMSIAVLCEDPVRLALVSRPAPLDVAVADLDQALSLLVDEPSAVFLLPASGAGATSDAVCVCIPANEASRESASVNLVNLNGGLALTITCQDSHRSTMPLLKALLEQGAHAALAPAGKDQALGFMGRLKPEQTGFPGLRRKWVLEVVFAAGLRTILPRF